jgi:hypothetical protein
MLSEVPDAVRTHFIASESKEKILLAKLLLLNNDPDVKAHTICSELV